MDSSVIEKLKEEVKEALEKGKPEEALKTVMKYLSDLDNTPLNIAITGESGSGKSSFVNAIRGIGDEEPESAKTGVVETTMVPTPYCHRKYKSVIYWDLPGIGTPNFKSEEYLKKVDFEKYDFFIIIASDRFKESHILLAKEICKMNKKFYFVRSKIDRDIKDSQERRSTTFNKDKLLDCIRQNCVTSLSEGGITDQPVFLVSSWKLEEFDWPLLLKILEKELPSHKRHIYSLALPNICSDAIEIKMRALRSIILFSAMGLPIASIIPGVSNVFQASFLTDVIKGYVKSFGLDEESLVDLARMSDKSVSDLKGLMKSPFVIYEINNDLVEKELKKNRGDAYMTTQPVFNWIPVLSMVAGEMSAIASVDFLNSALDEIAQDAQTVLDQLLVV